MLAEANRERETFLAAQQGSTSAGLLTTTEGNYADAVHLLITVHNVPFDGKATLFAAEYTLQEDMTPEQAQTPWITGLDIYRQNCAYMDIISSVTFRGIGPIIRATLNK